MQQKIALTIDEAADITGIGRNSIRQLVAWKKIPVLKVGRKMLLEKEILEKFLSQNEGCNLRDREDVQAVIARFDE